MLGSAEADRSVQVNARAGVTREKLRSNYTGLLTSLLQEATGEDIEVDLVVAAAPRLEEEIHLDDSLAIVLAGGCQACGSDAMRSSAGSSSIGTCSYHGARASATISPRIGAATP